MMARIIHNFGANKWWFTSVKTMMILIGILEVLITANICT